MSLNRRRCHRLQSLLIAPWALAVLAMAPELVSAAAPPAGVKAGGLKAGAVRTGGVKTIFTGDVINGKKVVSSLNTDDLEPGRKHLLYFQGVQMSTGQYFWSKAGDSAQRLW